MSSQEICESFFKLWAGKHQDVCYWIREAAIRRMPAHLPQASSKAFANVLGSTLKSLLSSRMTSASELSSLLEYSRTDWASSVPDLTVIVFLKWLFFLFRVNH